MRIAITPITVGIVVALVSLVLIIMLVMATIEEQEKWVSWCEEQGGHVITNYDTAVGVGIGSDGGTTVVVTGSIDYYCLSGSGGIIDIR